jgi:hypothetical protein
MCLWKKSNQKEAIQDLFGNRKEIVCYKLLDVRKIFGKTRLKSHFYNKYTYHIGINKCDLVCETEYVVNNSIHVFLSLERAKCRLCNNNQIIIPVICRLNNLVAVGKHNEAAFKQVRLRKRDYVNAINGKSKYKI